MRTFHYTKFTTHNNGLPKAFTAELSDLGKDALQRVWPDACDVGLKVQGRTGAVVTYVVGEESRDLEGELICLKLVPTLESIRKVPACKGTTVVLFND